MLSKHQELRQQNFSVLARSHYGVEWALVIFSQGEQIRYICVFIACKRQLIVTKAIDYPKIQSLSIATAKFGLVDEVNAACTVGEAVAPYYVCLGKTI